MKNITNFVLSITEPSKQSGWLKPLGDGSYGMYVFAAKGWTYVGKTQKESVTGIKVNGENVVNENGVTNISIPDVSIPDIQVNGVSVVKDNVANIQVVEKPKGYIKVYNKNDYVTINNTKYPCSGMTTIYIDTISEIKNLNNAVLELHNVKPLKDLYFNSRFSGNLSSILLSNVDSSETNFLSFFSQQTRLKKIKVEGEIDMSNTDSVREMFGTTDALQELDLSKFNFSTSIKSYDLLFKASGITELDVSNFDTCNVENMSDCFFECTYLTKLDLSMWNTSKVKIMNYMFSYCTRLKELYLEDAFTTESVERMNNLFLYCSALTTLKLGTNFGKMKNSVATVDFSSLTNWTNDSVQTLTTLYDRKSNGLGVITLKLSTATKTALGTSGITTLTNKGYTIA